MDYVGQGAIEYLLIIAAAILVVAIVILAVTGALSGGQDQTTFSNLSVQKSYSELQINLNYQKTGLYFGSEITPEKETKLANGLVGLWNWNDNYDDLGPNNFQNTSSNNPGFDSGLWGTNALTFGFEEDKYVQMLDNPASNQQVTYSIWFKPIQANDTYIFSLMSHKDSFGLDPDSFFHWRGSAKILNSNKLYFGVGSWAVDPPDSVGLTSNDDVLIGQWNHLIATIDFDDKMLMKLYLNGVFQGEDQGTKKLVYINEAHQIWIGRRKMDFGSSANNFVGQIEEFAMWNRIFSDGEIKNLFDKGAAFIE